jgi:hypothetical protein
MFRQLPGLQVVVDAKLAASVSPVTLIFVSVDSGVKLISLVTEAPKLAVTVAVWLLLTVPAVAVKVPLLEPVWIVMLPGTTSFPVLLDRLTTAMLVATLVRVTVQVMLHFLLHLTECTAAGDTRPNEKVREVPLALAVSVAV